MYSSLLVCILRMSVTFEIVVWFSDTFENIFGMGHDFTKYLMESFSLNLCEQFFLKYFHKYALFGELSPKLTGCF